MTGATVIDALVELAELTPEQRERWFDHRMLGLTLERIAERDGITRGAIWNTIQKADRHLARRRPWAVRRIERREAAAA